MQQHVVAHARRCVSGTLGDGIGKGVLLCGNTFVRIPVASHRSAHRGRARAILDYSDPRAAMVNVQPDSAVTIGRNTQKVGFLPVWSRPLIGVKTAGAAPGVT